MVPQSQRSAGAFAGAVLAGAILADGVAFCLPDNNYGQVIWAMPLTVVDVPLLAEAVAPTSTVPDTPATHWTVAVPGPVETMLAIT